MQLNGVVFPAPECSYGIKDFPGELIYIPRYNILNNKSKRNSSMNRAKTNELSS